MRKSRRRVVAGLAAATVLLIAVTTGTAWALSSAASPPGLPSPVRGAAPVAEPTAEVAATEPAPPGDSPAAAPLAGAGSGMGQPPAEPATGVHPKPQAIPPLKITTYELPPIALGESWSVTFEADGGVGRYTWSIINGAVPAGLVLQPSGRLSGKATAPGPTTFTIGVEDEQGEQSTRKFTLSPRRLTGDVNGDGAVDCADMDILRSEWGQTRSDLRADLNDDDTVGSTDMSIMLSNWTGETSDSDC